MPFAASCCDGSGRSQSSGTRASSYGRPSRVVAIVNRTIALCLEHCNTFAAQPAPPNSLHAYCGQRALATRTGRPVAFSAVIGRASMGAANGLGGLDVADIRTCGCRVPGVDLGGRLSAGVEERGFEERVEDRVHKRRTVLVRKQRRGWSLGHRPGTPRAARCLGRRRTGRPPLRLAR